MEFRRRFSFFSRQFFLFKYIYLNANFLENPLESLWYSLFLIFKDL